MIDKAIILKILEAGVHAPSGSNSQPWRFEVRGNVITIFMLPEKDHPILNFRNRGTLIAHGALIENISIAAGHYGMRPDIKLFPDNKNMNVTATITLNDGQGKDDPELFKAIPLRATNRKPYDTKMLGEDVKNMLRAVPTEIGEYVIMLRLTDDRRQIETLAKAASVNEIVMFENMDLHHLLFKEIVWTEQEEKMAKTGLYLKTMELKPPQALALKFFRSWGIMSFFNRFGAARGIAKGNAKGYAACAAYGAVLCGNQDEDFIAAGRVIERAWLKTASLGLSFHLQTGVNFLWQRIHAGEEKIFSPEHIRLIDDGYKKIADIFGAKDTLVPAIFRIGYDGEPSGRSSRKAPEVLFV